MGNAGNSPYEYSAFRTALKHGNFAGAMRVARSLPRLGTREALELTLLAVTAAPERYDKMALRWLRLLVERHRVDLNEVAWVAERLSDARQARTADEAIHALRRFVGKASARTRD